MTREFDAAHAQVRRWALFDWGRLVLFGLALCTLYATFNPGRET